MDPWFALFAHFLLLSLLAIGGAITVAPDMHRVLVDGLGLLTDAQFNASIAIAQAAPGPNVLFVAVMGYQAAGLAGAVGAGRVGSAVGWSLSTGPAALVLGVGREAGSWKSCTEPGVWACAAVALSIAGSSVGSRAMRASRPDVLDGVFVMSPMRSRVSNPSPAGVNAG